MAPQLMWIGLGNMGRVRLRSSPLTYRIQLTYPTGNVQEFSRERQPRKASHPLQSDQKALRGSGGELPAGKTEIVDSIEEGLKKADIIFTIVSNDAAVKETIGTILQSDVKGKLIVDCSTIHPDTTKQVAQDVLAKGTEFVASPVFGAPAAADAGMLM